MQSKAQWPRSDKATYLQQERPAVQTHDAGQDTSWKYEATSTEAGNTACCSTPSLPPGSPTAPNGDAGPVLRNRDQDPKPLRIKGDSRTWLRHRNRRSILGRKNAGTAASAASRCWHWPLRSSRFKRASDVKLLILNNKSAVAGHAR